LPVLPGKGAATASGPWSMSKTSTAWCEQRWWARLDLRGGCAWSAARGGSIGWPRL